MCVRPCEPHVRTLFATTCFSLSLILLAEQNTMMALRYSNYGYILENGRVVMDGEASALAENEDVKEFYLGVSGDDRRSFRNVKAYRRRKRWLS